jgi:hypothetical protein
MSVSKDVLTLNDILEYRKSNPASSCADLARSIIIDRGMCQYLNFSSMLRAIQVKLKKSGIKRAATIHSGASVNNSPETTDWSETNNSASFCYKGTKKITNLEEALEESNVDLEVWDVEKQQFKCWTTTMKSDKGLPIQVQNYSCNIVFKKRISGGKEDFLEAISETLSNYKVPVIKKAKIKHNKNCGIINIYDAHIDKFSWIDETMEQQSSIDKNINRFVDVFDSMLNEIIIQKSELIIFPVGNDFFNRNSIGHESTKRGTPQYSFVSGKVAYKHGLRTIIDCINKAASVSKVIVPVIEGNHDMDNVFYLGESLDVLYANNPNVVIQSCGMKRKYSTYGENMFGFAHGDIEKKKLNELPLSMAIDEPDMFAKATFREFFLGDIHHKQEHVFKRTQDFKGVIVRFLRLGAGYDLHRSA